jgi:hypothetical protein
VEVVNNRLVFGSAFSEVGIKEVLIGTSTKVIDNIPTEAGNHFIIIRNIIIIQVAVINT